MGRVYNFSAGPAVLPEEVLREAAAEMLDYRGTGMSVMEMSHRSGAYEEIINTAEKDLRELMSIPDNYKVLFLQGGASQQFAMIPMNLMKNRKERSSDIPDKTPSSDPAPQISGSSWPLMHTPPASSQRCRKRPACSFPVQLHSAARSPSTPSPAAA